MRSDEPLVSVFMVTFNQAEFVRQAIESVLAQEVPFPFELVIGDDASSDGTGEVIASYKDQGQCSLRVLPRHTHLGAIANSARTLRECRGRYIALCEGDDYWIDPSKLRRQVGFLASNRDHTVCYHHAMIEFPDGRMLPRVSRGASRSSTAGRLVNEWLMTTASVCFVNPGFEGYDSFVERATHPDLGLFLFAAKAGFIGRIDRSMSVYRQTPSSMMASFRGMRFLCKERRYLRALDRVTQRRYSRAFSLRIARIDRAISLALVTRGRVSAAARCFCHSMLAHPADPRLARDLLRLLRGIWRLRNGHPNQNHGMRPG